MLSELWSDVRYRVRALFRRDAVERELDDELTFHLEQEAAKYERAGIARSEARRRARLAFGGIDSAKEASRDRRGTVLIESTLQDLRYAARGLRAKPVFAVGVMLTLGLGIGANATMFGIVDRLLFRPPAYLRDATRVHRVFMTQTVDRTRQTSEWTSYPRYLDFVRSTRSFDAVATFATWNRAVGDGDAVRQVPVAGVSATYFDFFDAHAVLGRWFTPSEDVAPHGAPVVVLAYAYWQSQLAGNPDLVGRTIRIGHTLCTIIGVAPPGFVGMEDESVPAMFIPITTLLWDERPIDYTTGYGWQGRVVIVRRKPGVSIQTANADLTQAYEKSWIAGNNAEPGYDRSFAAARPHAFAAPVQLARGPDAGPQAKVVAWLGGVALIVLLVACANVANLLLGRAVARRREIALRLALGVGRARLVRQLLTETLLLAAVGGLIGLIVARWGGTAIRALFLQADGDAAVFTDLRTLVVTGAATLSAALVSGLVPIAQTLKQNLSESLTTGGRDAGARTSRERSTLLVFQAAFSTLLLVGAGLFVRSLANVRGMHLGYDVAPVLTVTRNSRGVQMTTAQKIALEARMAAAARATPGVVAAVSAPSIPFWAFEGRRFSVPGIDSVGLRGNFLLQAADTNYFRTVGTQLLRGRAFDGGDRADAPPVVIVGEGMAKALWPGQDPIGKCIRIWLTPSSQGAPEMTLPCRAVVGVVEDVHNRSLVDSRQYMYYVPLAQYPDATGMVLVRVAGNAADYAEAVRRSVQRIMPGAAYVTTMPLRAMVDPKMESWRTGAMMFVAFGVLALTLAAVGLYSVIAYSVAQRRKELGVRIALGALPADVVGLVLRGGLRVVIGGIVIGSVLALWAGRWIAGLLSLAAARVDANTVLRTD